MSAPARILLVDDDQLLLDGLRRQLRRDFSVETAVGGEEGLACIGAQSPFTVVLSDYQMPHMNGAAFLAAVGQASPDTTRMLLTGQADLAGAAAVVNEGGVFRFLLKPVERQTLVAALQAGVEQHRLVTAERELLERTLSGSVKALMELLSLASPLTFARATRLRNLAALLLEAAGQPLPWAVDLAVMLSQVGAIALPPAVLERLEAGRPLPADEAAMVQRLPVLADEVLAGIPRLDEVRAGILGQDTDFADARGGGTTLPLGARVLRIVRDYEALQSAGRSPGRVLRALRARPGLYDPELLEALAAGLSAAEGREIAEVPIARLEAGMVLAADVVTGGGVKLIPQGHEISRSALERIRIFSRMASGVREPVVVLRPAGWEQGAPE